MAEDTFEPIRINGKAPGGERVLKGFDDITTFILVRVEPRFRELSWWQIVRSELLQARSGARQKEAHAAMCAALAEERWLARPAIELSVVPATEMEEAGSYAIDPPSDSDRFEEIEQALRKARENGPL
jgi:hypothetical protein